MYARDPFVAKAQSVSCLSSVSQSVPPCVAPIRMSNGASQKLVTAGNYMG